MLGCHHHGVNPSGRTVFVFHRNLRLAVGAEKVQRPTLPGLRQVLGDPVGVVYGHGHENRGFVAGIAEHQPLVSSSLLFEKTFTCGDSLGDIR